MITYRVINLKKLSRSEYNQFYKMTRKGVSYMRMYMKMIKYFDIPSIIIAAYDTKTKKYVGWVLLREKMKMHHKEHHTYAIFNFSDINIYVKKAYRRRGIGNHLIDKVLQYRNTHLDKFFKQRYLIYQTDAGIKFWDMIKLQYKNVYSTKLIYNRY